MNETCMDGLLADRGRHDAPRPAYAGSVSRELLAGYARATCRLRAGYFSGIVQKRGSGGPEDGPGVRPRLLAVPAASRTAPTGRCADGGAARKPGRCDATAVDPSADICCLGDVVATFERTGTRTLSDAIIEEADRSYSPSMASSWTSVSGSKRR